MSTRTTLGWAFKSPLSMKEMEQKLKAWPRPFEVGDSDRHGDYLGGKVTDEGVARVYDTRGGGYLAELRFFSAGGDVRGQLDAAKDALLGRVLPLLMARDVAEAEPLD